MCTFKIHILFHTYFNIIVILYLLTLLLSLLLIIESAQTMSVSSPDILRPVSLLYNYCLHTQATEMLLFNKKLTATQACELGLVTEVFPDNTFQNEVWTRLKAYAKLPRNVSARTEHVLYRCGV